MSLEELAVRLVLSAWETEVEGEAQTTVNPGMQVLIDGWIQLCVVHYDQL